MMRDRIINEYFQWLCNLVCEKRYSKFVTYEKLLTQLHSTEFRYSILKDQNREEDGIDLRYRFALSQGYDNYVDNVIDILDGPCSVLEMMIALAIRCEENIMDDPCRGNRTGQWFWGMVNNLGLGVMIDNRFDKYFVHEVIERFLDREYEPDGTGGLFRIKQCNRDLRTVEIWYQLCWYLDSIT
jgi:hypothetical protein